MSIRSVILFVLLAASAAACGDAVGATTGPTEITPSTQVFSGRLEVGSTRFYSFTMSQGGTMNATLASIASVTTGNPVAASLSIGFGTPRGTGCDAAPRVDAAAALMPHITRAVVPGVYCLEIADSGRLTEAVAFAVRFVYQ